MDSKGNNFSSHEIGNAYCWKHSKNGALAIFCTIFRHISVSQIQLAPIVRFITFWVNISDSVAHAVKAKAPCQETRPVVSWPSVFLFSSTRVTGYPEIMLRHNVLSIHLSVTAVKTTFTCRFISGHMFLTKEVTFKL